jgi:general stress protein 26
MDKKVLYGMILYRNGWGGADVTADLALCADLMTRAEAAYVTTVDEDGFPQTRAMFNLRRQAQFPVLEALFREHAANLLTFFTTNTSSRKVAQLAANAKAAVYYAEPAEFRGLNLVGWLDIVTDDEIKHRLWQPGWERYYPGGPTDPDYAVLRMRPMSARYYHRLQVIEVEFPS